MAKRNLLSNQWFKGICCLAAGGIGALILIVGMGMLPQADCPLWLPLLSALAAAGLCAWCLFAPKCPQKTFRHGGQQLAALCCAALLCTLLLECFGFNHRAFVTRHCQPMTLSNEDFYALGEYPADLGYDGEILVLNDDDETCTIYNDSVDQQTIALGVTMSGEARPVKIDVYIHDFANSVYEVLAASGVCVPGADGLNTFYCALYSNEELSSLKLVFTLPDDQEAAVTSVVLNPKVPVQWQPLRMALCFGALLLLLCAIRFPWLQTVYDRRRLSHRLVLLIPMILLMVFTTVIAVYSTPKGENGSFQTLMNGNALEDVTDNEKDGYGMLFAAFLKGQVHLIPDPDPNLLAMENPYDKGARGLSDVTWFPDCALYDGHYYVYFGPGPVLLTYYPYYWLTGRVPSDMLCGLFLSWICIPLCYVGVCGFMRRYTKKPNLFLLSLGCLAVCCVAGLPRLLAAAARYENVVAMNIGMMAGAVGFGLYGIMEKKPWKRSCLFVLCGVCFALQGTCRANTLLITTAFLALPFVNVLRDKTRALGARLGDGACFLVPALLGVGGVMLYNYARFGSVAEFGQLYQITNEDIRYNVFRPEFIPQALWHYFLTLPAFQDTFPYVAENFTFTNVAGNDFWTDGNVGMLSYPLLWLLLLSKTALRCYRRDPRELRTERNTAVWLPALLCVCLCVVSHFYAGVLQRYTHDFLFTLALLSLFVGLSLQREYADASPVAGRGMALSLTAACSLSILLGIAFVFSNERMFVEKNAPELYYTLVRMFFPY
ncbi:MAG: hypothetical protein PHI98_00895 [Eubacteriales bacterium]|nr:hypothetical protein [Eubacteriales bacterium]